MKKFFALMLTAALLAITSAAYADMSDAIVRIAVTGKNVNVRMAPSPKSEALFKASAPAEYIAARCKPVYAGSGGDGSEWYELIGVRGWENFNDNYDIAPSLEGRSAAGALLDRSMYISAKYVREIPLRDGDAEAVRDMIERRYADAEEPQDAFFRFLNALARYVGRTPLEAASLHSEAVITKWWDTDDEGFELCAEFYTDKLIGSYLIDGDGLSHCGVAQSGAEIGGLVLGKSTEADVRAILGEPLSEGETDEGDESFKFYKRELSGGVQIRDPDRPAEGAIPFKAVRWLNYGTGDGEGVGCSIDIYFDDGGRAVAISMGSYGWR